MYALIIGAVPPHQAFIQDVLRTQGYKVIHKDEVEEAWAVYIENSPRLVVLTEAGPPRRVLARRIREHVHGKTVILLAMVEPEAEAYAKELLEAGIDDCILASGPEAYLEARLTLAVKRSYRRQQRYQIEDELLYEQSFVSTVLKTTGALVVVLDAQGRIVRFNRACEATTGYTFEEVKGHKVWDFLLLPEEVLPVQEVFKALGGGAQNEYENYWVTKTGEQRLISWSNTTLPDETGEGLFIVGTGIDVTEQMIAQQALEESEERTRAILDTTVDGIITIDERGLIDTFNAAAERIFGYAASEVIGQNIKVLMPGPYKEEHDSYIQNYLETGHKKIIGNGREVVGQRKDGSIFPMDLAVSELQLPTRRIFTGIIRDVSARRSLEQEILRISDQERRRIGQDLHDGLGQMLTGIGLISKNLARSLEEQDHAGADEVAEVTELIKEADQHARILARGLIPVDLEASGLAAALRRLTLNAERLFGIRCSFEEVGEVLIDDNSVATHLYRIAQESVSNAVKHGRARQVRILLAAGRQIRLRIHDDGVGFPEKIDEERRGMGVRIMHYRARVIGATLDIADGLDGGTTITCTLRRSKEPIHLPDE